MFGILPFCYHAKNTNTVCCRWKTWSERVMCIWRQHMLRTHKMSSLSIPVQWTMRNWSTLFRYLIAMQSASFLGIETWVQEDVIKWKHFVRYWPFVRGIHRSPVNSPHKGQWRGALIFSLIYARINGWVNNGKAGDLRRYWAYYDGI